MGAIFETTMEDPNFANGRNLVLFHRLFGPYGSHDIVTRMMIWKKGIDISTLHSFL
jgi:hypothetical protein